MRFIFVLQWFLAFPRLDERQVKMCKGAHTICISTGAGSQHLDDLIYYSIYLVKSSEGSFLSLDPSHTIPGKYLPKILEIKERGKLRH